MENYKRTMEKYSSFANYELLKQKMDSITNPIAFYNLIKDKELIVDLTYQSDQVYSQVEFNKFVEDWGVELQEDAAEIVEDFMDFKYEAARGQDIEF